MATYAADAGLLRIAEDTVANAEKSVRLTRARLQGGIAPRTDLRQAEQILEGARADAADQKTALAGREPAAPAGRCGGRSGIVAAIDRSGRADGGEAAGLDSLVLLRRPDVVEAEYQLRAANAQIRPPAPLYSTDHPDRPARAGQHIARRTVQRRSLPVEPRKRRDLHHLPGWRRPRQCSSHRGAAGRGRGGIPAHDPAGVPRSCRRPRPARYHRRAAPRAPVAARSGGRYLSSDRSALSERHRRASSAA